MAPTLIDVSAIPERLMRSKWEVTSLSTNHNAYVDDILVQFTAIYPRLSQLANLSPHVMLRLYTELASYLFESLLDAYASIKRCTTEGRAQMSLDLNVIKAGLEKHFKDLSIRIDPLPEFDLVSEYIRAFYLPEEDFFTWVASHLHYRPKQLLNLAAISSAVSKLDKKQRQAFFQRVDELVSSAQKVGKPGLPTTSSAS